MTTLSEHLRGPRALGSLASVIEAIGQAGISIGGKIRRARIEEIIGELASVNVQGEMQQKLDVLSDEVVLACLRDCPSAGVYASEAACVTLEIASKPAKTHPLNLSRLNI